MSTATEILKQFFAAINRNVTDALVEIFDPEFLRIEPEAFGRPGLTVVFRKFKSRSRRVVVHQPKELRARRVLWNGNKVVVYLHARVRLKDPPNG